MGQCIPFRPLQKDGVGTMAWQGICGAPLALSMLAAHPRARLAHAGALAQLGARSGGAHRGAFRRTALPTRTHGDPTLCAPAAVPQVGPAHQAQHHKRAGWTVTNEHPATCTQRAARARCTHTPPAPPSQCTRSLDLKSLAGNFQAANSMASGMEAVRRATESCDDLRVRI